MCRIDAHFGNHHLDEKKDPTERFLQALDEYEVEGKFRSLLIKHLSDSWPRLFQGIQELEAALNDAKQYDSEQEKCIAVLLTKNIPLRYDFSSYANKSPIRNPALIEFLDDVKQTYFQDSPFSLYNGGMNKVVNSYFDFISLLYGESFCFSKAFFDDESLNTQSRDKRANTLWDYFYTIAPRLEGSICSSGESSLPEDLTSLASSISISGPLNEGSTQIFKGLAFLKAWIKFDSQAGRLSGDWTQIVDHYDSPWESNKCLLSDNVPNFEEMKEGLLGIQRELNRIAYVNADLNNASDAEIENWAFGLDRFSNSFYEYNDHLKSDKFEIELNKLRSQLTPLQIDSWIKFSIKEDFQFALKSNQSSPRFCGNSEKWISPEYFGTWKKIFLEKINNLGIEDRIRILSTPIPNLHEETEAFYCQCSDWWHELLSNLIILNDFPKKLIPSWTLVAIERLDREAVLPYIDKSIGILRGELSKIEESAEEKEVYHQQLEKLLAAADKSSSAIALRHRLLLMRSSTVPFTNESVSKEYLSNKVGFHKWYSSLRNLIDTQFSYQVNGNRKSILENYSQVQNDFFVAFSNDLAEFSLSRLRLRKGEKTKDGEYDSSQVIEQSPIWRQGYLKVLTELGFDLNGRVHKTVNFTKKSDPDKDVRAIASECYKAVRRNAKKSPSIQDMKRGIIAAEWWLLLCQRRDLGLKINYEEALKTRRNQLRNP